MLYFLFSLFFAKRSSQSELFTVPTVISLKWKDAAFLHLYQPLSAIWHCSLCCLRAVWSPYTSYSKWFASSGHELEVKSRIAAILCHKNAPHKTSIFQHSWHYNTLWGYKDRVPWMQWSHAHICCRSIHPSVYILNFVLSQMDHCSFPCDHWHTNISSHLFPSCFLTLLVKPSSVFIKGNLIKWR